MFVQRKSLLAQCISLASVSGLISAPAHSLPQEGNNATVFGDATYTLDSNTQATISASTDSVIEFFVPASGGSAFSIPNDAVLNLESTGGAIDVLADVIDNNPSEILGQINGDGNVSFFIRNRAGVVFGENASVLNVPALLATTHAFENADFVGFANGDNPLALAADGGSIDINGLTIEGGDLILIADVVNIAGDVVSSGEIKIAIGETVELALPASGSGLLSVDITEALSTSQSSGNLIVGEGSSVSANTIDWQAAVNDPGGLGVNIEGLVMANGVAMDGDGAITIVAKGADFELAKSGELNAADGTEDVSLLGDFIILDGEVRADEFAISLGSEAASIDAAEAVLDAGALAFEGNTIDIVGAQGPFNHVVEGFADYTVTGTNSGTAALEVQAAQTVSFSNIAVLETSQGDNNITIENGGSIDTIRGNNGNDTFTVRGAARLLEGSGGNDLFRMDGGVISGNDARIDGGSDLDTIENVIAFDGGQQILDEGVLLARGTSDFITSWTDIEAVTAGPVIVVAPPTPTQIDNINATTPVFSNLNASAVSGLNLVGDDLVKSPCGSLSANNNRSKEGLALANMDEDCFNKPEYLALINTTVYFNNDSASLLPTGKDKLNRVSSFVLESGQFREITVSGHTDSNASHDYNLALSEKRVDSAIDYMADKGVDTKMFKPFFYGESTPAAPNDTEANRALNRRVVVELKK